MTSNHSISEERSSFIDVVLITSLGVSLGLFILIITGFTTKWAVVCSFGILIASLSVLSRDVKRFFLTFFVFSIPICVGKSFFYQAYAGGVHEISINLIDIFLVILYFLWGVELLSKRDIKINFFPQTTIPALFFIGISLLSISKSKHIDLSLFELIRMIKVFLIYFYIANNIRTKRDIKYVLIFLLLGVFCQSLIAVYQKFTDTSLGLGLFGETELIKQHLGYGLVSRVGGTIGISNALATYLILLLPLSLTLLFIQLPKIYKALSLIVLISGTIALIFTLSRGAWVSFVISIFLVYIAILSKKQMRIKSFAKICLSIIILLALITSLSGPIVSRFTSYDYESAYSRIPMMRDAWEVIKANPILGIGLNNYSAVILKYDVIGIHRSWQPTVVHNIYLLIAAETGIFGLIAFLWFISVMCWKMWQFIKTRDGLDFGIALGIFAGLFSFLIYSMVGPDYRFYSVIQILFWFLCGYFLAIENVNKEKVFN